MKRWVLGLGLAMAVIISFVAGAHYSSVRLSRDPPAALLERELAQLRDEVAGFFYDTMGELLSDEPYTGGAVSESARSALAKYRSRLEPRCRLVNISPEYGRVYGMVLFPSGDVFEVAMDKRDEAWQITMLNHLGTEYFYHDRKREVDR